MEMRFDIGKAKASRPREGLPPRPTCTCMSISLPSCIRAVWVSKVPNGIPKDAMPHLPEIPLLSMAVFEEDILSQRTSARPDMVAPIHPLTLNVVIGPLLRGCGRCIRRRFLRVRNWNKVRVQPILKRVEFAPVPVNALDPK